MHHEATIRMADKHNIVGVCMVKANGIAYERFHIGDVVHIEVVNVATRTGGIPEWVPQAIDRTSGEQVNLWACLVWRVLVIPPTRCPRIWMQKNDEWKACVGLAG
tara:strand:- start:575 stop:889 length:315 start_codon:yes stop_codon:yes gene_type:complete